MGYSETSNGYRILHTSSNKVTISRTVTFDEIIVKSQRFIDVTDTHQPSNADAGCDVQPSHPNPECSTAVVNKTINYEDQVHVDAATGEVTATRLDIDDMESIIRRSMLQNKGIPAKRLSFMVRTAPQCEPES